MKRRICHQHYNLVKTAQWSIRRVVNISAVTIYGYIMGFSAVAGRSMLKESAGLVPWFLWFPPLSTILHMVDRHKQSTSESIFIELASYTAGKHWK